jgi:NAD(P)-dependent dehydrogenase (short-subunit alcohol dehydrogenase family)
MINLKHKIIVVTGGSGLIGKAILADIKLHGAIGINAEINLADDINNGVVGCDVTKQISIENAIEKILNTYGTIDGWVNNAYPRTTDWGNKFEKIAVDSWAKNVDMQLNSIFTTCQAVSKIMTKQQKGSIVNISSIYGVVGPDFSIYDGTEMTMPAAYSAIKGGVVNFTRYLASYIGRSGVRVNCVSPGGIFDKQNSNFVNNYAKKVPLGRMGLPEDIAPSVSFLLSDASSYITGHNLIVDGGWTAI